MVVCVFFSWILKLRKKKNCLNRGFVYLIGRRSIHLSCDYEIVSSHPLDLEMTFTSIIGYLMTHKIDKPRQKESVSELRRIHVFKNRWQLSSFGVKMNLAGTANLT